MHPELSALSAQGHFLVWQMRPILLPLHRSQPARVLICPAGRRGPLRPHEERWVQRAVCPVWMLLRELFANGRGWGFSFQDTAPRRRQRSAPAGPPATLGDPHMPPLLCQALCSPLVLKGISSLQHSLSIEGSGIPNTRLASLCWPGVRFDVRKCWRPVPWQCHVEWELHLLGWLLHGLITPILPGADPTIQTPV